MNYSETLDWLFSQLPMYQRTGGANYKIDLEKTWNLMDVLDHPEEKLKTIHVAGTNGKGSTSHMLASIFQEAGYKVGLYTSPHLIDFRERIRINGTMISQDAVIEFVKKNRSQFQKLELSFFEMTVGLAFEYFSNEKVDLAIIETGMGGRLDSTNVLKPMVSVITNIGLDHQAFLGDTIEKIAFEKAGIIKKNIPVVIGETQEKISGIFKEIAINNNSEIHFADQEIQNSDVPKSDLKGIYQNKNKKTTLAAIRQIKDFNISKESIDKGLLNVTRNTGFSGRWQVLKEKPYMVCDTAHNEDGINEILKQINQSQFKNLHIVWGMVDDKNVQSILRMLPEFATYYFTQPSIPRALNVDTLYNYAINESRLGTKYRTVKDAVDNALKNANNEDMIYIGGSTFVVADLLESWSR